MSEEKIGIEIIRNGMKTRELCRTENLGIKKAEQAAAFHASVPGYRQTELKELPAFAGAHGIHRLFVKDEGTRFGLKAFKGLGGIYAVFMTVCERLSLNPETTTFQNLMEDSVRSRIRDMVFITTTDGNHGKGVSWAAGLLGCRSYVYMPAGSLPVRAQAIRDAGSAEVFITKLDYDSCVRYTAELSREKGWQLLQDTAWPGYETVPKWIMQGYLTMAKEAADTMDARGVQPTHVFLQAGVGSMAGAVAAYFADRYRKSVPSIITVEAKDTACVYESIKKGTGETVPKNDGGTIMAGLNCGEVSSLAWPYLRANVSFAIRMEDEPTERAMHRLVAPIGSDPRIIAGESGAATFGALLEILEHPGASAIRRALCLDEHSTVLLFVTESDTGADGVGL